MIKWLTRLAFITGLLGLVGTIAIILHLHEKKEDRKIVNDERQTTVAPKKDTVIVILKPVDSLVQSETVVLKKKEVEPPVSSPPIKHVEEKIIEAPAKTTAPEKKATTLQRKREKEKQNEFNIHQQEKLFRPAELQRLVNRINRTKTSDGLHTKCVQIYTNNHHNFKRTIPQIEVYLKSRGFSIAGRELVSEKVKGIKIRPHAGCIRITVGSF